MRPGRLASVDRVGTVLVSQKVDRVGTVLVSQKAYSDGSFKQVVWDAQNRPRTGPPPGFWDARTVPPVHSIGSSGQNKKKLSIAQVEIIVLMCS